MSGPAVTFLFVCYRQERYVRDAVRSALAQYCPPMEIIVSDDCSPDDTYAIVSEEVARYRGPHRVVLNRNPSNLGAVAHLNAMMARAGGELIVVGCGDDLSAPERTAVIADTWRRTGAPVLASGYETIDADGVVAARFEPYRDFDIGLDSVSRPGFKPCPFVGATMAWHRKVFDRFGPVDAAKTPLNADAMIHFRGLLLGGNHYIDQPLLRYRSHRQSELFQVFSFTTPDALVESQMAWNVSQALYMLETLKAFRDGNGAAALDAAESALVRFLFGATGNWVRARNRLLAAGHRATWTRSEK